ncbi:porin [Burkholderia sp. SG-MS1]|uniref:porin n=1 Tax=Paraburkholderia sp. SG-MS1 TaxID=2023741 RepID=UPI0014457C06|nr:porin [Paraburkholderia sp. SG-MS1]NKJ49347.1 porin [Paraburkholderia sp. SG-MS1]
MKKPLIVTGTWIAALVASEAQAQSSVTLYGLIDAGVMYTNNAASRTAHGALWQATSGTVNGSRFGLRGAEDLGGGVKAIFVLESGFNVETGKSGQNGRLFGRQAYVGLNDGRFGTLTLGRQYDSMTDSVTPLSAVSGKSGSAGFSHPFDNDNLNHSVRISNAAKYASNDYGGLLFNAMYAFSNGAAFSANRAWSGGASYTYGPFGAGLAYLQIDGSRSGTGSGAGAIDVKESSLNGQGGFSLGAERQRTFGGGLNYRLGPAVVGFVYTHSQLDGSGSFGSSGGNVSFHNFEVNGKYMLTSGVSVALAYTYTKGHVDNARTYGADPKWNQLDLQTVYSFSKRTDVYAEAMYQHVTGKNYVAFIKTAGAASSTANQVVGTLGMRTRF